MLRHIWVTPKQFCELTNLSMDEMNSILLGHANTSSVKHYRRMTSKVLAEGTKKS